MTEYICFYHAVNFLQAKITSKAPINDLKTAKLAIQILMDNCCQKRYEKVAIALQASLNRHTWYLVPQVVPVCLADDDLEVEEKLKIANKLLSEDYPEKFDVELAELAVAGLTMDTQLSDLISPQLYLLFEALGWRKSDVKELVESNFDIRSDIY